MGQNGTCSVYAFHALIDPVLVPACSHALYVQRATVEENAVPYRWFDGRRIGPNDTCPCGSGVKAKRCCSSLMQARTEASRRVGAYLMLEQLWPGQRSSLSNVKAVVRSFDPTTLIVLLASIGFLLHEDYFHKSGATERVVLRKLFPPDWFRKIELWLSSQRITRVTHRLQIPVAIRLVLLSTLEEGEESKSGREVDVGPMLLELNGLIDRGARQPHELEALVYRLCFYSHREGLGSTIGRQWLLMRTGTKAVKDRFPGEYFDASTECVTAFGFPYEHLLAVCLAILSYYDSLRKNRNARPEQFIIRRLAPSRSPELDRSVPRVFEYLSKDVEEFAAQCAHAGTGPEALSQVFPLYDHPLLRLDEDRFIPLDLAYLAMAGTEGAFWRLLQHLHHSNRDKDAGRLKTTIGRAFEWYAAELLRPLHSLGSEFEVWCEWDDPARPGLAVPDAIVADGETVFVVELTTASLPPGVAVSSDPNRIAEGLSRHWFGAPGHSAKLHQLEGAWNRVRNREFWPLRSKLDSFQAVPLLVSLRCQPLDPLLWDWYQQLMDEHGSSEEFRTSLALCDVSELEDLCTLRMGGHVWKDLFAMWKRRLATGEAGTMADCLAEAGMLPARHPLVQEAMTEAFQSTAETALGPEGQG